MALVKCPDCGKMVSERAVSCPECGCPTAEFEKQEQKNEEERRKNEELERKEREKKEQEENLLMKQQREKDKENEIKLILKSMIIKTFDWEDIIAANDCVANDIKDKLQVNFPVHIINSDNAYQYLKKVENNIICLPCVVVVSNLKYYLSEKTNTTRCKDGRCITRYLDINSFPGFISQRIQIVADKEEQLHELYLQIMNMYSSSKEFAIKDVFYPDEEDVFNCVFEENQEYKPLYSNYNDDNYFVGVTTICCQSNSWIHHFDRNIGIKDTCRATLRWVQLAQYLCVYISYKNDSEQQIKLYGSLRGGGGFFQSVLGYAQNDSYKMLKNMILSNQPINEDLVNKAFPHLTAVYHNLYNDIMNNTPVSVVEQRVKEIFDHYIMMFNYICDYLNLPANLGVRYWGYTKYANTMRCNDALVYCLDALIKNQYTTIDSIVNEYRQMVEDAAEKGRIKAEEEREERENRSPGILSTMINQGIESRNIKKNRGKVGKRDLIGQAGCAKNYGGSCSECNIRRGCSRYYF